MVFFISLAVFSGVTLTLVLLLLFVESKVVQKGDNEVTINQDPEKAITVPGGATLLTGLVGNGVLIPSACGGSGTCGMCKCTVTEGGGDVLPTELSHLSRMEMKSNVRLACQLKVKAPMAIEIPDEIFNIRKYNATVVSNDNVATFIKELILKVDPDETFDFEAGHYIQIDIPEYRLKFSDFDVEETYMDMWQKCGLWNMKAASDEPIFRAYSLANPPYEKEVRLTVRIATPPWDQPDAPPGIGSSWIFNLKPGDPVTFSGPYGDFFVKETKRELCFIGGGAGMAPMRCHILHQLNTLNTNRKVTYWYGARSVKEMFYDEDFRGLEERFDNFRYHVALSAPLESDKWDGPVGYIHHALYDTYLRDHEDPTEIEYYLCGPPAMIDAALEMLDELGVEEEMIAYDKFS